MGRWGWWHVCFLASSCLSFRETWGLGFFFVGSLNCKEGGETAKEPEFNYSSVNLYFFIMCVYSRGRYGNEWDNDFSCYRKSANEWWLLDDSMNEMCFYQLFFRLLLCLAETISLPKVKRWEWQLLLNFSPWNWRKKRMNEWFIDGGSVHAKIYRYMFMCYDNSRGYVGLKIKLLFQSGRKKNKIKWMITWHIRPLK